MKPVLFYILQVLVASGLLYCYYHFALRNKRFHRYNRYYLLAAILVSSVIPFLNIPIYFTEETSGSSAVFQTLQVISSPSFGIDGSTTPSQVQSYSPNPLNGATLLYILYFIVVIFFLFRILFSLRKINGIIRKYPAEQFENFRFVNTDEPGTPFSFFRWLFWNRKIELNSEKGEQIFRHELFHIQQKHSWDIVFMEILSTLFWINPFFHLIKKELKAIHEFLADEFAIKENRNWQYAELLLMQALNTNNRLVNPFFHNQIKRRIAMITLSRKPSYQYLRKIMVLPIAILIVSLFAFSYKKQNKKGNDEINQILMHYGADTTKQLNNALVVIDGVIQQKRGIQNIDTSLFKSKLFTGTVNVYFGKDAFNKYGEKGKDGVIELFYDKQGDHLFDTIPKIDLIEIFYDANQVGDTVPKVDTLYTIRDIPPAAKKSPTIAELKSWMDAKTYGIWIDGKRTGNGVLNNYTPDDFSLFYVSKLSKNAVNYGKHYYQVNLYTHKYYDEKIAGAETRPGIIVKQVRLTDTTKPEPSQPLIVIDGKPRPDIVLNAIDNDSTIVANNIRSITVLKGQSAIDKYGDKAKDGAIEIQTKNKVGDVTVKEVILKPRQDTIKPSDPNNIIFSKVEVEPSFPGGEKAWHQFLEKNINVNVPLSKNAPKGTYTVVVQFIVDREGNISDLKALTNHGYGMEGECLRVMTLSPKWKPAIQNGRIVKAYRKQPMTFVIGAGAKNGPVSSNTFDPSSINFDDPEFKRKWREMILEIKAIAWKEGKAAYVYKGRTYVFGRITNPDPTIAAFTEQNGTDHVFLLNDELVNSVDELNSLIKRSDVKKFGFIQKDEALKRFNRKEAIVFIETDNEIVTKN